MLTMGVRFRDTQISLKHGESSSASDSAALRFVRGLGDPLTDGRRSAQCGPRRQLARPESHVSATALARQSNETARVQYILGGTVLAGPVAAIAQQQAVPVIGYLANAKPEGFTALLQAFRQGLAETGYVERRNVLIEYRWAEGDADRLPRLAACTPKRSSSRTRSQTFVERARARHDLSLRPSRFVSLDGGL